MTGASMTEEKYDDGTSQNRHNLLWFATSCLDSADRLEHCIAEAEAEGDAELADLFSRAQSDSNKGAFLAQELLSDRLPGR